VTGIWEDRLNNIAYGLTFGMPDAATVIEKMEDLKKVLLKAANEPGASGRTGDAAAENLRAAATRAQAIADTTKAVKAKVDEAAEVQFAAQTAWQDLPEGELSQSTIDRINSTADGDGVNVDEVGMCLVKNANTLSNVKAAVAAKRESAAKTAVEKASDDLDKIEFPPEVTDHDGKRPGGGDGSDGSSGSYPSSSGSSQPRSFSYYPDASGSSGGGGSSTVSRADGSSIDWGPGSYPLDTGTGSTPSVGGSSHPGGGSSAPGDGSGGGLTPNGQGGGGTTWTGGSSGAATGLGIGGSAGSGLLGNIGTGGAVAGAGGAALFGGARLAGGFGATGGAAATGGVSGSGASAGGSLGVRGAAGVGGASGSGTAVGPGGVGGLGRGGAAGTAGRTGGLLGGTRAGSGAGAASSSAGAGAGGRSGAVGAGGRPGAAGRERDKEQGRGLGGPIAPHLEDEEQRGPRSASAGAGGRG